MSADSPAIPARRETFYDRIADDFDRVMNRYDLARRLEVVFGTLLSGIELSGRRVLDAGCGTGWFSHATGARGARVVALDIGPRLLRHVRQRCPAATIAGDVTALTFSNDAFDVVISSECIEHTTDPRRAVHELLRVCRTGGFLVITCPNRAWHWSCRLANRLRLRPYDGLENWPGWFELRRWIGEAGGQIVRSTGIHAVPFILGPLNPILLRPLDRLGRWLGPLYVNQAVLIQKRPRRVGGTADNNR